MKKLAAMTVLLVSLGTANFAWAFDISDIMIHGFLGQGYLKSSDNNFLGNSEEGSYEFNEMGINLVVPLTDELRFGFQFFSRDIGEYGNNEVTLDWAFLAYEWQDWLKFRVGKVKMPFGLYNGQRDADMLRTSVLLPQTVYPEGIRDFVVAFNGVDIYGTLDLKGGGDLEYDVFGGTINMSPDSPFLSNLSYSVAADLQTKGIDFSALIADTDIDLNDIDFDTYHMEGGQLIWNMPIGGLRAGVTYLQLAGGISLGTSSTDLSMDLSVFSAEYERGPLLMAAEYLKFGGELEFHSIPSYEIDLEGWYGSLSWRIKDWLSVGASYGEYYPISDDKDGDSFVAAGLRDYYAWQKDAAISLRFDINEYWAIKLETHFMNGVALCNLSENPEIMDENWNLYIVKTSLSF